MLSPTLEIDDDDHPFLTSFLLWSMAVVLLVYLTKRNESQQRAAMIDPASAAPVRQVREQVQRQRSQGQLQEQDNQEGLIQRSAVASSATSPAAAASPSASASASQPPPLPQRADDVDCSICLDKPQLPVETNCSHIFCAQCILSYHQHQANRSLMRDMIKCPCCRRQISVLAPAAPGWTAAENDSEQGRKLKGELAAYNRRFSSNQRSFAEVAQDTPHFLGRFFNMLISGDPALFRLLHQARFIFMIGGAFLYLLSPLDLLSESAFGLIGLFDDLLIFFFLAVFIAGFVRSAVVQQVAAGD